MIEINKSCTPEQAKSIRRVLEEQGFVEGKDFIDHTKGGTDCCSEEEMKEFKETLWIHPPLRRRYGRDE